MRSLLRKYHSISGRPDVTNIATLERPAASRVEIPGAETTLRRSQGYDNQLSFPAANTYSARFCQIHGRPIGVFHEAAFSR